MNKKIVYSILLFFFFQSSLLSYSSNPKDFVDELVQDAITKLADKNLEKNSIDLYSSMKSIYLQDRQNKIKNSIVDEDEWGNLDN